MKLFNKLKRKCMIVVQNNVKKGIEIPEIEVTKDSNAFYFAAIDKVKYADFLALGIKLIATGEEFEGIKTIHFTDYTGDTNVITFSSSVDNYIIAFKTDLEESI